VFNTQYQKEKLMNLGLKRGGGNKEVFGLLQLFGEFLKKWVELYAPWWTGWVWIVRECM
jgi:hypothetical protein